MKKEDLVETETKLMMRVSEDFRNKQRLPEIKGRLVIEALVVFQLKTGKGIMK